MHAPRPRLWVFLVLAYGLAGGCGEPSAGINDVSALLPDSKHGPQVWLRLCTPIRPPDSALPGCYEGSFAGFSISDAYEGNSRCFGEEGEDAGVFLDAVAVEDCQGNVVYLSGCNVRDLHSCPDTEAPGAAAAGPPDGGESKADGRVALYGRMLDCGLEGDNLLHSGYQLTIHTVGDPTVNVWITISGGSCLLGAIVPVGTTTINIDEMDEMSCCSYPF